MILKKFLKFGKSSLDDSYKKDSYTEKYVYPIIIMLLNNKPFVNNELGKAIATRSRLNPNWCGGGANLPPFFFKLYYFRKMRREAPLFSDF